MDPVEHAALSSLADAAAERLSQLVDLLAGTIPRDLAVELAAAETARDQAQATAVLLADALRVSDSEVSALRAEVARLELLLTAAQRGGVRIGMSSPAAEWANRLAETGPVWARRLFGQLNSAGVVVDRARSELAAGRMPVISFKLPGDDWAGFKLPGNDWAGAARGDFDVMAVDVCARLAALPGVSFVAFHHEPYGDGTPAAFASMQRRLLPIVREHPNLLAGVIANGWWWSEREQGFTDAEIAEWLPGDVLDLCHVVAADTYQSGTTDAPGPDLPTPKIRRLGDWARRVGVGQVGLGEWNALTAVEIRSAGQAILAESRMAFACLFNSAANNRPGVVQQLSGDRLAAFREVLAAAPKHV